MLLLPWKKRFAALLSVGGLRKAAVSQNFNNEVELTARHFQFKKNLDENESKFTTITFF